MGAVGDNVDAGQRLHPHLSDSPGFFKRFRREVEVGRRVRHANVVRTLDADEIEIDGGRHRFIVMEHVEGRTLRALLEELGVVPEGLCRHVGREVAQGLAAIHVAGAVHRDVKPENVLITGLHAVKVMDLGVARLADEQMRLSGTGAFVGSVLYAEPEQFSSSAQVDGRADLHALGLVLYELATGRHPFEGSSRPLPSVAWATSTCRSAGSRRRAITSSRNSRSSARSGIARARDWRRATSG